MKAVKPESRNGFSEIVLGKHQPEYVQLPANRSRDRLSLVETKWELDEVDRAKIAAGEHVYLTVLTFGSPFQPVRLQVGAPDVLALIDHAGRVDDVKQTPLSMVHMTGTCNRCGNFGTVTRCETCRSVFCSEHANDHEETAKRV